ncbi:NAD(P)/FAD-dependent oxidoreductase [Candidatus Woesearchaeota archaeon]|nr:NAD(P)/FAD-dependent oxidoreductase [Candidatus Woesearchaeota archaeon]
MITIAGAGPVGCHAAKLLAQAGEDVHILEEHNEIGRPLQCTGIVTQSINDIVRIRKGLLVNRLRKVRLHAPCGETAVVRIDDLVIDRAGFDRQIADDAADKGANISLSTRLQAINEKPGTIRLKVSERGKTRIITTEKLVGADGPGSIVSRHIGNKRPGFWIGVQAVVQMPVEKDTYSVYFGDEFPGFFGWVVPENEETARVGIAAARKPREVFDRFVKRFDQCKVLEMQGGLIPKYDPALKIQRRNAYIVGDAAAQVKATTGGGLVPGMKAAECLSRTLAEGTSYKKELSAVRRELRMSLILRGLLDRFSNKDYDELVKLAGGRKMQEILKKEDRDRPSRIVFKSIIKEPKLLLFARTLFRAKRVENANAFSSPLSSFRR